jgi:hypothetical protein
VFSVCAFYTDLATAFNATVMSGLKQQDRGVKRLCANQTGHRDFVEIPLLQDRFSLLI